MSSPLDRHEKIALSYSGGKDSTAVLWMLREHLPRMTVYHVDTGDLLPEMQEQVARFEAICPAFVRISTQVRDWIAANGHPSDLLPHTQHAVGRLMGEHRHKLVGRYDCCYTNLMAPLFDRVRGDGMTLLIRGTKSADMAQLPVRSGETHHGVEIWYPLQDWTNDQVFAYLREHRIPIPYLYNFVANSPECARCTAWWKEKRAKYLKAHHPELFADYADAMGVVMAELQAALEALHAETAEIRAV